MWPLTVTGVTGTLRSQISPAPLKIDQLQVFQGVRPDSGEVVDIAIDPSGASDQTIFVATNDGCIWKSTDGGATWTLKTEFMPSLSMGAVALDPDNPQIVCASTGNLLMDAAEGLGPCPEASSPLIPVPHFRGTLELGPPQGYYDLVRRQGEEYALIPADRAKAQEDRLRMTPPGSGSSTRQPGYLIPQQNRGPGSSQEPTRVTGTDAARLRNSEQLELTTLQQLVGE